MEAPRSSPTFGGSPRWECAPSRGCRHTFLFASQEGRELAELGSQWPFRTPVATAHSWRVSPSTPRLCGLRRTSEHLTNPEWPSQHRCGAGRLPPLTELREDTWTLRSTVAGSGWSLAGGYQHGAPLHLLSSGRGRGWWGVLWSLLFKLQEARAASGWEWYRGGWALSLLCTCDPTWWAVSQDGRGRAGAGGRWRGGVREMAAGGRGLLAFQC